MDTIVPGSAADTLESMRDLGVSSLTDAAGKVVSMHRWYDNLRSVGSLLIVAGPEGLDSFAPPDFTASKDERQVGLYVNVNPDAKAYLDRFASGEPLDLFSFWGAAAGFYNRLREYQVLGSRLLLMDTTLSLKEVLLDDPFGQVANVAEAPVRGAGFGSFLGRLLRRGEGSA